MITATPTQANHLATKAYYDAEQFKQDQKYQQLLARIALLESIVGILEDKVSGIGKNCLDIKNKFTDAQSGLYEIDPDGAHLGVEPFKVWCDMAHQVGNYVSRQVTSLKVRICLQPYTEHYPQWMIALVITKIPLF
ncbi:hypothetical protein J8L98_21530 [Pseudoalteromonas sp. MMG013]|nr:hypothetical protein [Pseudoalteromonas sp. MMG013]